VWREPAEYNSIVKVRPRRAPGKARPNRKPGMSQKQLRLAVKKKARKAVRLLRLGGDFARAKSRIKSATS
jgi:hypothetical protein